MKKHGVIYIGSGFGPMLYGKSDRHEDGSYVGTKWFVFFFIPLIPIASYRVYSVKSKIFVFEYKVEKVKLHKKQIRETYLYVTIPIIAFFVGAVLIFRFAG